MELVHVSPKELETFSVKPNDLLFARQSLIAEGAGKCSIVLGAPQPTVFESHLIRVRLNYELCDPVYYYYFLSSQIGRGLVQGMVMEVAASGIRGSDLAKINVPYPPLATQRRVSSILTAYDDLIEVNNQRIKVLEETAREIYKEWFVRMRFPAAGGKPGHTDTKFVKGVPEGWAIENCYSIAEVRGGGTPLTTNSEYWDGPISFFTPSDHPESVFTFQTEKNITVKGLENSSTRLFPKYTTFITARGTVGNICMSGSEMAMNQSCFGLISKERNDCFFVFMFVDLMIKYLKQVASGATFDAITLNTFKNYKSHIPNRELRIHFHEMTSPLFLIIETLIQQNTQLRQIRDRLLPRLISGKLPVE